MRRLQRPYRVYVEYSNDEEKEQAEQTVAHLWNIGKVIHAGVGD